MLILDDWLIDGLCFIQTKDILEILDDWYNKASTILATQLPVSNWHSRFEDPALADAIMEKVVHNACRIELNGESMRKRQKSLTQSRHLAIVDKPSAAIEDEWPDNLRISGHIHRNTQMD